MFHSPLQSYLILTFFIYWYWYMRSRERIMYKTGEKNFLSTGAKTRIISYKYIIYLSIVRFIQSYLFCKI